jgi:hypothetical protein
MFRCVNKRESSVNCTNPELSEAGWLAAEPEATPQAHRLRPWGFPPVSPSHPNVLPHYGIQRITVEFSEMFRFSLSDRPIWCHTERKGPSVANGPGSVLPILLSMSSSSQRARVRVRPEPACLGVELGAGGVDRVNEGRNTLADSAGQPRSPH